MGSSRRDRLAVRWARFRWAAAGGLAVGLSAAACFSPSPAVGLPCSDGEPRCPDDQVCDDAQGVCVPSSALGTWRDDAAGDFDQPGAALEAATIEANGAIGPAPYFVNGFALTGLGRAAIGPGREATIGWDDLLAEEVIGHGFARQHDLDTIPAAPPPGSGATSSGTDLTLLLTGEIYLEAGQTDFQLAADDRGFFELADPDTGEYSRILASAGAVDNATATIPATGWYAFRGAYANTSGNAKYDIKLRRSGGNFAHPVADRLRVRVDATSGLALDGFDDPWLGDPFGTTLATYGLDALDYAGTERPPDVPDAGEATWSMRWGGQVLVAEPGGTYAFRVDSEGGHRLWIDGQLVAQTPSASAAAVSVTRDLDLVPGWHDLVVDLMKDSDSSTPTHLHLTVDSGPELVGAFFPVERTRPVIGRGSRWVYASASSTVAIPEGGTATKTVFVSMPPGVSRFDLADYEYSLTHMARATIAVDLTVPGQSATPLVAAGDLTGAGNYTDRVHLADIPAGGWVVAVTDTDAADTLTGSITGAHLAGVYHGGPQPFPTRAVYTSAVRDLGPVVAYSGVRWHARQLATGGVVVRVRSCAVACTDERWVDVPASGAVAGVAANPFLQYQVELTGDGDVPTALDWIELDYRM